MMADGNFNFKVKDYRIIRNADVSPDGITLIYGKNGNGKSTLIKSIVSLLSNKHSEDNFRHGEDSYSISAMVGSASVKYSRSGSTAQLQYNNETPKSKLGKGTLFEVEPRFPLKRVDYVDSYFYPNISFQNSIPIFEQISTDALFASMFSDVARISDRVTACRNDCVNVARVKNDSQVGSDVLKEKVLDAGKAVDKLKNDNPDLEKNYIYLKGLVEKRADLTKFMAEFTELSAQCSDVGKRKLVSLYKEAQPLFTDLVLMDKMRSIFDQSNKLSAELRSIQDSFKDLEASFPIPVVSLVTGVKQIVTCQSVLDSVHKDVEAIPNVPRGLVEGCSALLKIRCSLDIGVRLELQKLPVVSSNLISEVHELLKLQANLTQVSAELVKVNKSYEEVQEQLKQLPCERLANGLCPYKDKL
jgi:DNA repair ATPase RecN